MLHPWFLKGAMVKGIDHQTGGSAFFNSVFMTSKRYAEIQLGGDETNCLKKPPIMTVWGCDYKGFPQLIAITSESAINVQLFFHMADVLACYLSIGLNLKSLLLAKPICDD